MYEIKKKNLYSHRISFSQNIFIVTHRTVKRQKRKRWCLMQYFQKQRLIFPSDLLCMARIRGVELSTMTNVYRRKDINKMFALWKKCLFRMTCKKVYNNRSRCQSFNLIRANDSQMKLGRKIGIPLTETICW